MNNIPLTFLPIDLKEHAALCHEFFRATHLASFGSMEGFEEDEGNSIERFSERIRGRLSDDPESCLHVWRDGVIVGQLHLSRFVDPAIGYINFVYVTPECRGTGVAAAIERYAVEHFLRRGFRSARLSVTATNQRAIRFYRKSGWIDLGPRADRPGTHNMEKSF